MTLRTSFATKAKCALIGLLPIAAALANAQPKPSLTAGQIDHMVRAEWNKASIVPAPAVDDSRFLRRAYLDITGTIPSADTVIAFLADTSPDKRIRAVDSLLDSPHYADHWSNYWDGVLMGRSLRNGQIDRTAFHDWLHTEFAKNARWNQFVFDLVTATGVNSTGGTYAKAIGMPGGDKVGNDTMRMAQGSSGVKGVASGAAMSADKMAGDPAMAADKMTAGKMMTGNVPQAQTTMAPVNGAVNWILKYNGTVQDLSGTASKIFMGVQIQCAQCHDHKTEKWKQEDFRRFTACFVNARPRRIDPITVKGLRRVDLEDQNRPFVPARSKKVNSNADYARSQPSALDGTDFSSSANRRQALATWMTAPTNPWFAEAFVNRMWSHFLGRGFIEPIDDIRPSNPVVMPELLKQVSDDFVASGYDVKHLIRTICATQVYQLSSTATKKIDTNNTLWARYRLKPMAPEEMLDSLITATNMGPVLEQVAGAKVDQVKFAMQRQFTFLFDVDEEFEQKDFEGTIPQALMLLNGNLVNRGVTPIPGTALADVLSMPGTDSAKITSLYLRTLSRKPTALELVKWQDFLHAPRYLVNNTPQPPVQRPQRRFGNGAAVTNVGNTGGVQTPNTVNSDPVGRKQAQALKQALKQALRKKGANNGYDPLARLGGKASAYPETPEKQAYEDMFWALLNSSEFSFNH